MNSPPPVEGMSPLAASQVDFYRKLVRDRIPEIIRSSGDEPVCTPLDDVDHVNVLIDKAHEELAELRDAPGPVRLDELADVFEVVRALCDASGFSFDQLTDAASRKRAERGGFDERVWLEKVVRNARNQH